MSREVKVASTDLWQAGWESTRVRQLRSALESTPQQRLQWLEDVAALAYQTGAFPRLTRPAAPCKEEDIQSPNLNCGAAPVKEKLRDKAKGRGFGSWKEGRDLGTLRCGSEMGSFWVQGCGHAQVIKHVRGSILEGKLARLGRRARRTNVGGLGRQASGCEHSANGVRSLGEFDKTHASLALGIGATKNFHLERSAE